MIQENMFFIRNNAGQRAEIKVFGAIRVPDTSAFAAKFFSVKGSST